MGWMRQLVKRKQKKKKKSKLMIEVIEAFKEVGCSDLHSNRINSVNSSGPQ